MMSTNDKTNEFESEMSDNSNTNLIINYLPQLMTDEELRELFDQFGEIRSAKIIRNKSTGYSYGFGFVDYLNAESAHTAIYSLNGHKIGEKSLKVAFARAGGDSIKNANLYVKNLPINYIESDIRSLFSRFGHIIQVRIVGYGGVAFVRFDLRVQANAAIEAMNGKVIPGADNGLIVKFAIDNSQKSERLYLQDLNQSNYNSNNNRVLSPVSSVSQSGGDDVSLNLTSIPSGKLLAVLQNVGDHCPFCEKNIPEHVHYIVSSQLTIDPSINLPKLLDQKCYACGDNANNLKLCAHCKTATYCDVRCQLNDWAKHNLVCSADSNEFNTQTNAIDFIAALGTRDLELYRKIEAFVILQDNDDKNIFHIAGDVDCLTDVMSQCVAASETFKTPVKPNCGQIYLVKHSDNEWYRALILSTDDDSTVAYFIDFGNTDKIRTKFIMPLPDDLSVSSIPGLAVRCVVNPAQKNLEAIQEKIEKASDGTYLLKIEAINKEGNTFVVNVF